MIIVGVNAGEDFDGRPCDNGGAAILVDGMLAAAAAEERFSRKKYSGGYSEALSNLLKFANLDLKEVDVFCVSFFNNPHPPPMWAQQKHRTLLLAGTKQTLAFVPSHHLSHAYQAFFQSPFEQAAICIWDHEGTILSPAIGDPRLWDRERHSYYFGSGNQIEFVQREMSNPFAVGFGKAYSLVTNYVGLGTYLSAGKLMGLSSYGDARRFDRLGDLWEMRDDGTLTSKLDARDGSLALPLLFARNGVELSAPATSSDDISQWHCDLAAYVQCQIEKWANVKIKHLAKRLRTNKVCLSGGVALNSLLNSQIEKQLGLEVFVPSYASDPGQALGNAIWGHLTFEQSRPSGLVRWPSSSYLGTSASNDEILYAYSNWPHRDEYEVTKSDEPEKMTAELLAESKLVGWYQGRSEFGARALGNRSILANPTSPSTRDFLNRLKKREAFRPFAPAIMDDHLSEWFCCKESQLWRHMLGVADASNKAKSIMPAVVHVDGTSRLQSVSRDENARFYSLIEHFFELTGVPAVLNTSLNNGGQPMAERPIDALEVLRDVSLDALVANSFIIRKRST